MYVKHNIVVHLNKHCCHRKVRMCSLRVVELYVVVNNIQVKLLSVATKMQPWVPSVLLSSYKIFCTAVNNINVLKSSCERPNISVKF
jgi:hypothetical protein